MRARRRAGAVLAAVALAVWSAGCTSDRLAPPPDVPKLWADRIAAILNAPDTPDFERQVLSDYRITDAEYQESQDRFAQCMRDRGWAVAYRADGGYTVTSSNGLPYENQAVFDATARCQGDALSTIQGLYLGMRDNPSGQTGADSVRACFRANGVSDGADMSVDQFAKMLDDPAYCPSSLTAMLCCVDPTGTRGLTADSVKGLWAHVCAGASAAPTP